MNLSPCVYSVLVVLCMLCLSSCMVNHARVYEQAFEYDGVLVEEPTMHYMHGGKPYRRGTRVRTQWTRDSSWASFAENIVGPSRWELTMIPGSESVTLCRELVRGENGLVYHPDSEWQEATFSMPQALRDPADNSPHRVRAHELTTCADSQHLTWRGLYALPAAVALFVVETPVNLVSSVYHLLKGL